MFTCAAVVDGIARMAAYASPSDAVRKLSTAVARIMSRTDASVKSAFASASVVDAVLTMSTNATTSDAVEWVSRAIYNIVCDDDVVPVNSLFGFDLRKSPRHPLANFGLCHNARECPLGCRCEKEYRVR